MLKFILTFVFVLHSKEDPCTLKMNLELISSLLHLSYFETKMTLNRSHSQIHEVGGSVAAVIFPQRSFVEN